MFGLAKLKFYAGVFVALVLAIVTFGASERRKGRVQERTKTTEVKLKSAQTAKEVRDDVQGMDDQRVAGELDKWMRRDDSSD